MISPTEQLWHGCYERMLKSFSRRHERDPDETESMAAQAFMDACRTYRQTRGDLQAWFLLVLGNAFRRQKRNYAVRARLLPRAGIAEPFAPEPSMRLRWFLESLDDEERIVAEAVLGYDQSKILQPQRKGPDAWPVRAIVKDARARLARQGWDRNRLQRVFRWLRQAWEEAA